MTKGSKIFTVFIILLTGWFIFDKFGGNIMSLFNSAGNIRFPGKGPEIKVDNIIDPPDKFPSDIAKDVDKPKGYELRQAYLYFLTLDKSGNSVYKKVRRIVPEGEDKFVYALTSLLKGPDIAEKAIGTYSEIPLTSKLNKVKYTDDSIIIDVSSDFSTGGGSDSIYSRMMQLIKTSSANADGKKIYLYSEGKKVNTIGGEGIMITQPLTEKSLEN